MRTKYARPRIVRGTSRVTNGNATITTATSVSHFPPRRPCGCASHATIATPALSSAARLPVSATAMANTGSARRSTSHASTAMGTNTDATKSGFPSVP